jgi:hypothetical protein
VKIRAEPCRFLAIVADETIVASLLRPTNSQERDQAMAWDYRVVPFSAQSNAGEERASAVASQFQKVLTGQQAEGFEYFRMDHYSLFERPGCIGRLFGGKDLVITYDVAIFRRVR